MDKRATFTAAEIRNAFDTLDMSRPRRWVPLHEWMGITEAELHERIAADPAFARMVEPLRTPTDSAPDDTREEP